ncbi:DNA repair protein rad16 [Mycoemilia scoparia]|uniref:DNA repair protein rad16 n=1 Tax=Mycoemilia scoparia TaxID=417184 RepID=A0A9W8DVV7_9FUNG|nr:DNA repair protein rad16 [Mycoemilia scoparia]
MAITRRHSKRIQAKAVATTVVDATIASPSTDVDDVDGMGLVSVTATPPTPESDQPTSTPKRERRRSKRIPQSAASTLAVGSSSLPATPQSLDTLEKSSTISLSTLVNREDKGDQPSLIESPLSSNKSQHRTPKRPRSQRSLTSVAPPNSNNRRGISDNKASCDDQSIDASSDGEENTINVNGSRKASNASKKQAEVGVVIPVRKIDDEELVPSEFETPGERTRSSAQSKRRRRSAPLTYRTVIKRKAKGKEPAPLSASSSSVSKSTTKRSLTASSSAKQPSSSSSILLISDSGESDGSDSDFCLSPSRPINRRAGRNTIMPPSTSKDSSADTLGSESSHDEYVDEDPKFNAELAKVRCELESKGLSQEDCNAMLSMAVNNRRRTLDARARRLQNKKGSGDKKKELFYVDEDGKKVLGTKPKEMHWEDWITYSLEFNHPMLVGIWEKTKERINKEKTAAEQPKDLKLQLLPFQLESLSWMRKQEVELKGGILADEMGMGKTIQMISLLLSQPRVKPTLVVAPTVALMQWKSEILQHTDALSVYLYYGQQRTKDQDELLKHDVIITTFSVMESVFRKEQYGNRRKGELIKEPSVLHGIKWARVVLDEAHNIKDRSCNTARSAFALNADRKWCLSGTPLQNRVGELYSLIRFLRADPFSYYLCRDCDCKLLSWRFADGNVCTDCNHASTRHICWWNHEILRPIQKYGASGRGLAAYSKLGTLLDLFMLRRTKNERAADLGLPPRVVVTRRDYFNPEEEDLYVSLFTNTQRQFSTYAEHGTVLNNYANIFELITKMRLAVNHPDLLTYKLKQQNLMQDSESLVCAICNEEAEDPIISKCKHIFCREDIRQYLETHISSNPKCPHCFADLTIDLSQMTYELPGKNPESSLSNSLASRYGEDASLTTPQTTIYRKSIVNHIDMARWRSSTKIEALVEELSKLRRSDATIKSIVFSQFVNFLDLVQWRLNRTGFSVCRLDGRMSPMQRDAVIKTFMTRPEYTVFLVSLKAGGVALNLIEASHVFICDPWWNPAVEDQAMDRIHRLGQRRPIKTTKLIVENSIESRIIELQKKKQDLFRSTIGKDSAALARLSEEDLQFLFTS